MSTPGNNDRWERGIEHHVVAEAIFDLIRRSDWEHGGDYFCWKRGGDGDNGETLMFSLSALLEKDPNVLGDLRRLLGELSDPPA